MLIELLPPQYPAVLPLFAPLDFNLVIRSIVAGNTPAWVFADDGANPRTALIWDQQDAILVAGEADPISRAALRDIILEQIAGNARGRGIPDFALLCTTAWDALISDLLPELAPRTAARYSYRLDPADFHRPPGIADGFNLTRIDERLLNSHLAHLDELRGWIDSFWHTPQDFLNTGYGYCAIQADTIAAWCLTVFAAGSARELGLATIPDFRQRGLATQVAAACLEHGLAHKQVLHWHCWAHNRPSALIAEKLGFHLERPYSVHHLTIQS
jgi:RimJ/RimL family protein N-acetyltransferase